jgi:DNA-binding NarL/FixJ family response regulator
VLAVSREGPSQTMIVQPDELCREGLTRLLRECSAVRLTAAAATAGQALAEVRTRLPDLVLTDVDLPDQDGLELISTLARMPQPPRVLVLSRQVGLAYVTAAIGRGARGYLPRTATAAELKEAIRHVVAGEVYIHPSLAVKLLGLKMAPEGARDLSDRECDLLLHLARGATNLEIAGALFISEKTVRNSLTRLFQRLRVRNRMEAVAAARELGYI